MGLNYVLLRSFLSSNQLLIKKSSQENDNMRSQSNISAGIISLAVMTRKIAFVKNELC